MEEPPTDIPVVDVAPPWKAMGLLFVPLSYAIGFLAWGVYAKQEGLGFLVLAPTRYLAAGMPVAVALYISWLVFTFFHAWIQTAPGRPWLVALGGLLIETLFITISIFITFEAVDFLFEFDGGGLFTIFLALINGVLYLILRLTYLLSAATMGWGIRRLFDPSGASPEDLRSIQLHVPRNIFNHVRQTAPALLVALVTVAAVHGWFALALTPPEFGGAEPRTAVMVLDSDVLTDVGQRNLLREGNTTDGGAQATLQLSVLVEVPSGYS